MRKDVDGTEMFDVYMEEKEEVVSETGKDDEDAETPGAKEEKASEVKAPKKPEPELKPKPEKSE